MNINFSKKITFIFFFIILQAFYSQSYVKLENLKSDFVKSENKEKYYSNLVNNIEVEFSKNKVTNQDSWIKNLRNAQSILLKNNFVFNGLKSAFELDVDKNKKLQQTALEVAYTLYENEFIEPIKKINVTSKDPVSFAISLLYLLRLENKSANESLKVIENRFSNFTRIPVLNSLYEDIKGEEANLSEEEIRALILHPFQKGKTILYSFQRKNRQYPGITIIKSPDGELIRNNDGSLFSIPQLALSYSNLPFYIPNGNTPQGIYSIIGWYISPTQTIGPTPNILMRGPFEVDPKIFYHGENKSNSWKIEDYKSLLPQSLQNNNPLYQSFSAGKIGRKLIIIHGSTDEPNYFKDKSYYPLTPTLGCLSSTEIWSEETGKAVKSDQVLLLNKFKSIKQKKGFLIIIEIDDQEKPVHLSEIERYLNK